MIQISPAGFREIQEHPGRGEQPGQLLVCGISDDIDPCVQQLLDILANQQHDIHYFLCSGSKAFHVPCYLSDGNTSQEAELPSVDAILNGIRGKQISPQYKAKWFEQVILENHSNASPIIVIECITLLQPTDRAFIERLLAFSATRNELRVIIFLHQSDDCPPLVLDELDQEWLLLLYLCGGRVRATDWCRFTGSQETCQVHPGTQPCVTTRRVGSEMWVCYSRCQAAEWAATTFTSLGPNERDRLIRKVLNSVQCPADYPTLALAGEIKNLDLPLARRAFPTLARALTEPGVMAKYFYQLRRWAIQTDNTDLISIATLNYLASLLCLPDVQTLKLYRVLRNFNDNRDKRSLARLYGELGQRLVKAKDAPLLKAAAECFQMSRHYVGEIEDLQREEKRSSLAAIANGEALLAFKQGQPELACQIEEAVLAELQQAIPNSQQAAQEVLLRTNLGDVYLRRLSNIEAAIRQYQTAYSLAMKHSPLALRCYIVPKLTEILMRMEQQEQVTEILEEFLARPGDGPDPYLIIEEKIVLKAQLTLAQAYWQLGKHRQAALWYWRLLQKPYRLAPSTLRGISLNLRRCRPLMSRQLKARIDSIVISQENMLASIKLVRDSLAKREN